MVRLPFVAWLSESDLMILFLLALVGVGGDARAICRPKAQLRAENPPPPPPPPHRRQLPVENNEVNWTLGWVHHHRPAI